MHVPGSLRSSALGRMYGRHLHSLVRSDAERRQSFGTFFLRNRPELRLMLHLLEQRGAGASLNISVLACSKGAEVYSIVWVIRTARPDLNLTIRAVDISPEILSFAAQGVYSCNHSEGRRSPDNTGPTKNASDVAWNTSRDQDTSVFERMTNEEIAAMFDVQGNCATIRPSLKEGIIWLTGDASDPQLVSRLGLQDIVVANRFLCHMEPFIAERCLRNIARLVKAGGYLFVSGVDLEVRTKVAKSMGWKPVATLMKEVHEGDSSLREGWPLQYWGLESFSETAPDRGIRYASVFQIGRDLQTLVPSPEGNHSCPANVRGI